MFELRFALSHHEDVNKRQVGTRTAQNAKNWVPLQVTKRSDAQQQMKTAFTNRVKSRLK
jgi:hypothetical protein